MALKRFFFAVSMIASGLAVLIAFGSRLNQENSLPDGRTPASAIGIANSANAQQLLPQQDKIPD